MKTKLNPSQVRKIQMLTNRINKYFGAVNGNEGRMSFEVETLPGGAVMLSAANNNDLRWFETWHHFLIIIGPRGGVERFEESCQEDKKVLATHKNLILN